MQQQQAQPGEARRATDVTPRAGQEAAAHRALLLDGDLFFAVKVADTLKHAGYTTRTTRRAEDFAAALAAERPEVALVNAGAQGMDWHAAVESARAAGVPVVVYAPHVDVAIHEAARAAGATSVIANSKLAADLPSVVARALRRGSMSAESAESSSEDPGDEREGQTAGSAPNADAEAGR